MEVDIRKCSSVISHIREAHSEEKKIKPRVYKEEFPGEIRFHIEMPGVDPNTIKIERCGSQIIIHAEMKRSIQIPGMSGISNVNGYALKLNIPANVEKIDAEFMKHGILVIHAKYKKETTERIKVKLI